MEKVTVKLNPLAHKYDIEISNDSLKTCGDWARNCLSQKTRKAVIVSNRKVFGLYGETVKKSLETSGFAVEIFLIKDGERYKNFRTLEETLKFFSEKKISRTDAVIALGGGVVGDLAGFAAAIFLRGIAFLQIPTTLLAMIDSSVGGKTGVNTEFGKNLIGAFHQPNGVLIDIKVLQTLARRELTAGFCEAVKQGAIADKKLFNQTANFLENYSSSRLKSYFSDEIFLSEFKNLIAAQVAFKAKIVMQDERESTERTDGKSRKILNFGHTLAHALEKVTDYKYFKHGEAVGHGILFAAELSKRLDILDKNEFTSVNAAVHLTGTLPEKSNIDFQKILEAFAFDKKSVNNSLQWILLKKIGEPFICKNEDIPNTVLRITLEEFLSE